MASFGQGVATPMKSGLAYVGNKRWRGKEMILF